MANMQSAESITLDVALATVIRQYRFVTVNSSGQAEEPAASANAVGVSLDASTATDADAISVAMLNGGKIKVEAGGTIAAGAFVATDNQGRAVATTTATTRALGVAVESASSGDIFEIIAGVTGFAANT